MSSEDVVGLMTLFLFCAVITAFSRKKDTPYIQRVFASFFSIILLFLIFAWLRIPVAAPGELGPLEIASLTFANGVFSGWADDILVSLFYSDTLAEKERVTGLFRMVILAGEERYGLLVLGANVIGAFLSILGVLVIACAQLVPTTKAAFALGFGAETAEFVSFGLGQHYTVGTYSVSEYDIYMLGVSGLFTSIAVLFAKRRFQKKH